MDSHVPVIHCCVTKHPQNSWLKAPLCSSLSWCVDGPVSDERLPLGASLQCGQVAAGVGSSEGCMSRMSAALVGWLAGPLPERGLSVWPAGASWEHGGLRVVGLFHGSCPAHGHGAKLLTTHPGTSDSTASYGPESKSWPPQIPVGGVLPKGRRPGTHGL